MANDTEKFRLVQTSRGPRTVFTGDVSDLVYNYTPEGLKSGFRRGDTDTVDKNIPAAGSDKGVDKRPPAVKSKA